MKRRSYLALQPATVGRRHAVLVTPGQERRPDASTDAQIGARNASYGLI
jgi:hypothetical protein